MSIDTIKKLSKCRSLNSKTVFRQNNDRQSNKKLLEWQTFQQTEQSNKRFVE